MDLEEELAKAICELNCWETPKKLEEAFGHKLNEEEIKEAMRTLEAFVPYHRWIKTWQKRKEPA